MILGAAYPNPAFPSSSSAPLSASQSDPDALYLRLPRSSTVSTTPTPAAPADDDDDVEGGDSTPPSTSTAACEANSTWALFTWAK